MKKSVFRVVICVLILSLALPAASHSVLAEGDEPPAPTPPALSTYATERLPGRMDEPEADLFNVFLPLIRNGSLCLNAPTLLDPANGSNLDTLIPLFIVDLGNEPNTTGYNLEWAWDADFTQNYNIMSNWGSTSGIQSYRLSYNIDPLTTLYWRAYKRCGEILSPYSQTWSFTTGSGGTVLPAPSLLAPADDTILPSLPVDLEWEAVNGAVEYIVHWTVTGYGGYIYSMTTDTNFTIGWGLDPNTTYDWWITARNDYAWGVDSEKWQFTTPAETLSISHTNINRTYSVDEDGLTYLTAE